MKILTLSIIALVIVLGGYYFFINNNAPVLEQENNKLTIMSDSKMSFFVTSVNPGNGGDLGGLEGADSYCSSLAESAGVTGKTWKAYLSATQTENSPLVNARDRIGTGPWYNSIGEIVAKNIDELHSENNLNKQTAVSEKGDIVLGRGDSVNRHDILTGSTAEGLAATDSSSDTTCQNWTLSTGGSAIVGHHDRVGIDESAAMKAWNSSHATRGCSLEELKSTGGDGLFYCFATN